MASFSHQRVITFGDTDAAGIVYTPRFSHFCMEAAEVWFREVIDYDWYRTNTESGQGTPVVHMEIDFRGPLVAGDRLSTQISVKTIGRTTIALAFEGLKDKGLAGTAQQPVFTGLFVFCCTGQNRKSMPVPARQRQLAEAFLDAGKDIKEAGA